MKQLLENLVAGGFGLGLVLLTGVGAVSYVNLERLIENRLSSKNLGDFQQSINLFIKNQSYGPIQIAIATQSREIGQQIQAKLAAREEEKPNSFQQRSNATDQRVRNTIILISIGYLFSFSLLAIVYFLLKRQLRVSQMAKVELQKLTQMLDFANDTIIICDLDNQITYWNQGAELLYGWRKEEAMGQEIHTLLNTVLAYPLKEIKNECLQRGYWEGELEHTKRDGTQILVGSRWTLERDEQGKAVAILQINNDITDRKHREDALRLSQERFALAVTSGELGVWDWNIQTKEFYMDLIIKQKLGYTDLEISNTVENWYSLIHPEDREKVISAIKEHLAGMTAEYEMEHRCLHKDGSIRWFLSRGIAFQDADGQPYRMTGIDSDISARKIAEIALHRSQSELKTLVENSPDMIARLDRQLRCVYVNRAVEKETGIPPEELSGKLVSEMNFPPELIDFWESNFQKVFSTGEMNLMEFSYVRKNELKFYQSQIVPEFSLDGELGSVLVISRDITNLKQIEQALQQMNEELEMRVKNSTTELRELNEELQLKIVELQEAETELNAVNRSLRVLSECNQAVVRAKEESSLLENVCHIIVEVGGYRLAWVGYALNDGQKTVQPVASAGYNSDYLQSIKITWDESEYGQGPTGTAIRTGQSYITQNVTQNPKFNPWREAITKRGYTSSIALPLMAQGKAFGALNIYAAEADAFDPEEVRLLTELAENLGYGILALRSESDRQRAEAALRQSERRYATLAEASPVGIFYTNALGDNLYVNERYCEIVGLKPQQTMADGWIHNLHPEDRERVITEWYTTVREQKPYRSEYRFKRRDSSIIWVFTQSVAEKDSTGEVIAYIGTVTDITERKNAEEILQNARDELEIRVQERTKELTATNAALQAEISDRIEAELKLEQLTADLKRSNQELEQFAYVASHDLQEPLRAVTGYTQLLGKEYEDRFDDAAREYMSYIVDGATRMRQLIQDLLAYSRVGTRGKEFSSTDFNQVLQQAIDNLQVAIAEKNAIITYDPMPTVNGDNIQLAQLFQNLIGNAIKFCRNQLPEVHISVELRNNEWLFCVSDNGIGIKQQYLERIFEIFKRLHTRREFPGTGIGLAICKKIVERHGGRIWAESQVGVGTKFYFTIPAQDTIN